MEHTALGTPRQRTHRRSVHPLCNLHRIVERGLSREIKRWPEAPSVAQVHPQHVFGVRSQGRVRRRHFPGSPNPLGEGGYPTMFASRNRCISLKTNDRDTFYPTINRGVFATLISRRVPFSSAQTSVKPCQMFFALTYSKQRIETQNKCQEIAIAFRTLSGPLSARIRASNSGYDGARKFPVISRNTRRLN